MYKNILSVVIYKAKKPLQKLFSTRFCFQIFVGFNL